MSHVEDASKQLLHWSRVRADTPPGEWPTITHLTSGAQVEKLPPGFTAFAVGDWEARKTGTTAAEINRSHIAVMPALVDDAPVEIVYRYLARVVTQGTGRCPLCSGRVELDREPPAPGEQGRAVFHKLPLYVRPNHAEGCPAGTWTDAERQFFVPYRDDHDERSR